MKQCNKCKHNKEDSEFGYRKTKHKTTLKSSCKSCDNQYIKERRKQYRANGLCINCGRMLSNTDSSKCQTCKDNNRKYKKTEKGKLKKRIYNRSDKNKIRINKWHRNKILIDPQYRIKHNLRSRLYIAIKDNIKTGSAIKDLGCSIDELKTYLEQQFTDGMSWDNYGNKDGQWSIDHIIPLHKVDLTNKDELLKVCHYSNLRPMWHKENMSRTYNDF